MENMATTSTMAPISRPPKVLYMGFFRTESTSVGEALENLGYENVFYATNIPDHVWPWAWRCWNATMPSLPSYNGEGFTVDDWEEMFGPYDAMTDTSPFGVNLIKAYPDAKVLLHYRNFDSWVKSWEKGLIEPQLTWQAWLSGYVMEPLLGAYVSKAMWRMNTGLIGVCSYNKLRDHKILRRAYESYYENIRLRVAPENLLEIKLGEWEPMCGFLGKEVPDTPFPHVNDSEAMAANIRAIHAGFIRKGVVKLAKIMMASGGVAAASIWLARSRRCIR
jgi:hypothetical protein